MRIKLSDLEFSQAIASPRVNGLNCTAVFAQRPCFSRTFVVQLLSHARTFVTPWTISCQAPLSSTISQSLLKLKSIELVKPSNHLILHCPLLLLPSFFLSIRVFSNKSAPHIRWPKCWSFSFSPSDECALLSCSVVSDSLRPHKR